MIPEGVHLNLTEKEYRDDPAISQSQLKAFGEAATPLHYQAALKAGGKKQTDDMAFGTVCHAAVLTPERFTDSYYLQPEEYEAEVRGKKVMKAWHGGADACKDWLACHADRPVMTGDDLIRVSKIRERLLKLQPFASALEHGQKEVAFFKRDEETGLMLKGRVDLISTDNSGVTWIQDLKKVQSGEATEAAFGKSCWNYGYHIQASFYLHITGASRFVFVPFDDNEPFDAIQYEPDREMLDKGYADWRRLLNAYAACVKSGEWPGYSSGINPLKLPGFVKG